MVTNNLLELQHPSRRATLSGYWELAPGRAISLHPHEAGVLRIAQGRVWATVDGPHQGRGNELGDHFLHSGQQLRVRPGQHLVFEPWAAASETPVYFEWAPVCSAVAASDSRWQMAVVRPLHDLGQALLMAGSALARLAMGLAGYGEYLIAGRGRVMPKLEANQP